MLSCQRSHVASKNRLLFFFFFLSMSQIEKSNGELNHGVWTLFARWFKSRNAVGELRCPWALWNKWLDGRGWDGRTGHKQCCPLSCHLQRGEQAAPRGTMFDWDMLSPGARSAPAGSLRSPAAVGMEHQELQGPFHWKLSSLRSLLIPRPG